MFVLCVTNMTFCSVQKMIGQFRHSWTPERIYLQYVEINRLLGMTSVTELTDPVPDCTLLQWWQAFQVLDGTFRIKIDEKLRWLL